MKRYIGIVCGWLCLLSVAQAQEKTSPFWGKQEIYLMNQTVKTFELVNQLLEEEPPSTEAPSLARRSALMLLDGVLHDTRLDGSRVYTDFIDARLRILLLTHNHGDHVDPTVVDRFL